MYVGINHKCHDTNLRLTGGDLNGFIVFTINSTNETVLILVPNILDTYSINIINDTKPKYGINILENLDIK